MTFRKAPHCLHKPRGVFHCLKNFADPSDPFSEAHRSRRGADLMRRIVDEQIRSLRKADRGGRPPRDCS